MIKIASWLCLLCAVTVAVPLSKLKIMGGDETDIIHHPWQVSLRFREYLLCGGSIISDRWILLAAHCGPFDDTDELKIKVGTTYLSTGGEMYNIEKSIIHPVYDPSTYNNDIALIKVDRSIIHPNASAIKLPFQDEELIVGTFITVTGWGIDSPTGSMSQIIMQVNVPTVSDNDCRTAYKKDNFDITDGMICAGFLKVGGKDACQGDSGGPAAVGRTIYGIVSAGKSCGDPQYPGIYTVIG